MPRAASATVADLRAALNAAGIEPPYVLVGHSLGSFEVRLFAFQHPEEVAGLVLVDPSSEHQGKRFRELSPSADLIAARQQAQAEIRRGLRPGRNPGPWLARLRLLRRHARRPADRRDERRHRRHALQGRLLALGGGGELTSMVGRSADELIGGQANPRHPPHRPQRRRFPARRGPDRGRRRRDESPLAEDAWRTGGDLDPGRAAGGGGRRPQHPHRPAARPWPTPSPRWSWRRGLEVRPSSAVASGGGACLICPSGGGRPSSGDR